MIVFLLHHPMELRVSPHSAISRCLYSDHSSCWQDLKAKLDPHLSSNTDGGHVQVDTVSLADSHGSKHHFS